MLDHSKIDVFTILRAAMEKKSVEVVNPTPRQPITAKSRNVNVQPMLVLVYLLTVAWYCRKKSYSQNFR